MAQHLPEATHTDELVSLDEIAALAERARLILGRIYDTLEDRDARERASRTPPKGRHRLMELVEAVNHAADDC